MTAHVIIIRAWNFGEKERDMVRPSALATKEEKAAYADMQASAWLADGNEAEECGDIVKAEKCFAKSQYWLDRYNTLTGNN